MDLTVRPQKLRLARAAWPWKAPDAVPGDLCFEQGELIEVVSTTEPGHGWLTGRLHSPGSSDVGIFPTNYIHFVPDEQGGDEEEEQHDEGDGQRDAIMAHNTPLGQPPMGVGPQPQMASTDLGPISSARPHQLPLTDTAESPRPSNRPRPQPAVNAPMGGSLSAGMAQRTGLARQISDSTAEVIEDITLEDAREVCAEQGILFSERDSLVLLQVKLRVHFANVSSLSLLVKMGFEKTEASRELARQGGCIERAAEELEARVRRSIEEQTASLEFMEAEGHSEQQLAHIRADLRERKAQLRTRELTKALEQSQKRLDSTCATAKLLRSMGEDSTNVEEDIAQLEASIAQLRAALATIDDMSAVASGSDPVLQSEPEPESEDEPGRIAESEQSAIVDRLKRAQRELSTSHDQLKKRHAGSTQRRNPSRKQTTQDDESAHPPLKRTLTPTQMEVLHLLASSQDNLVELANAILQQTGGLDLDQYNARTNTSVALVKNPVAGFPGTWEKSGSGEPIEGLFEVLPSGAEYWQIFEQLRAPTASGNGQMTDAWLSKVYRIQNVGLYRYFEFHKQRLAAGPGTELLARTPRESLKEEVVWHGTKSFPAHNIWQDTQDGFM